MIVQKIKGGTIPALTAPPPKKHRNDRAYETYMLSDVWECPQSPTGAHHWKGTVLLMTCIHCGETKIPERGFMSYYSPRKLQTENKPQRR